MRTVLAMGILLLSSNVGGQGPGVMISIPVTTRTEVLNEPFSADAITTTSQTLGDGTHISRQPITVKMYRDSAGRTRSDRHPNPPTAGGPTPPAMIMINDPVAGYSYVLETGNKVARRSVIQKMTGAPPVNRTVSGGVGQGVGQARSSSATPAQANNSSRPQFKSEDLGTQTMEGLTVTGRRTTVTYLAGSMGNDRDIVVVSDVWTNTEIRLMILQDRTDPRTGETTTKIQNMSRTQPDPSLFMVPPDYTIVDASARP